MRQQLYLESRFGYPLNDGSVLFWLQDQLVIPNPREYEFSVSVPDSSFPLTHYVINESNNTLELGDTVINLPTGNYNIDDLVVYMNNRFPPGMVCSYSENTNKITISRVTSEGGGTPTDFSVGIGTTCSGLMGVRGGDVSEDGVYRAPDGVNLAGTSSFYIKSNMRTLNRDPVSLGYSNIIAKIPITRSYNGVEKYQQPGFSFIIRDRSVSYIIISVLDDDMQPITFNGGSWSLTMEFAVVRVDPYSQPADYRTLTNNGGPLGSSADPPDDQRQVPPPVRQDGNNIPPRPVVGPQL
jgi:hypothetical protein